MEEEGACCSLRNHSLQTLFNYIVQSDVKRCQKSREANPVLMNGNRWVRQRAGLPPRTGVAQKETGCQGKKRAPERDEENIKNDEGVEAKERIRDETRVSKLPYNCPHFLKICVIFCKGRYTQTVLCQRMQVSLHSVLF